jgi:plasmid stability protein
MGDMLIRGIDEELKRSLEEHARRNRRSLSEEAIFQIRSGLAQEQACNRKAGDVLRALVQDNFFTDDELAAIEASRKEADREPPDLG